MAITNFFSQLAALDFQGSLLLTLKKDGENLTVSVLLHNDACADKAKAYIPPLILKGTAKELGEGFFPSITEPVESTSKLLVNMEQFRKGQEEAKKQSASGKNKNGKADSPKAEATAPKEKKYNEAIAQVDSLEAAGKFKEAWCKVPQPSDYPDKGDFLRKRRESLSRQFEPDLFATGQSVIENTQPNTEEYAADQRDAEGIPDEGEGE
jgi:PRTRC genetic system protein E